MQVSSFLFELFVLYYCVLFWIHTWKSLINGMLLWGYP